MTTTLLLEVDRNRIVTVGSSCIEKFWEVDRDVFNCVKCGNKYKRNYKIAKNRNRNDLLCDKCYDDEEREKEIIEREEERLNRKKEKFKEQGRTIFNVGKLRGKTYNELIEEKWYCRGTIIGYNGYDNEYLKFKEYLLNGIDLGILQF